ncbi:MAG TPA: hypothetical protein VNN08_24200 [Thermoanaerobaculia bacterium]|nr:hypothetical protein [Thermoanaerobaculia bacterium]
MKRLLITLFAALFALPLAAEVAPEHLVRLAESFRMAEVLGPRVWPGFTAADSPVILIDGKSEYLLNSRERPEGFTATDQTFRGRIVYFRPSVFPPSLQASFPAIGRPAVVIGTPEGTSTEPPVWTIVVLHELFHVYTFTHGEIEKVASLAIGPSDDGRWQLTYPFPYTDARVRRAMHVAGHALYGCIGSGADLPYEADVADEAVRTFGDLVDASFPGTKDRSYMKFVITKEGVARYFEYRIADLAARDYKPTAAYVELEGANAFTRAWDSYYKAMPFQIKHLGNVSQSRNEFYNLGMGIALVLDRIEPEWQKKYFDAGVWLDDLLHEAAQGVKAANACPITGRSQREDPGVASSRPLIN